MQKGEKKGVALVMAMWIMTILVMVATSFIFMIRTEIKMTTDFKNEIQAHYLARAGIHYAWAVLRRDTNNIDHLGEAWAMIGTQSFGEGQFTVTVEDEAGKMDLNAPLLLPDHWDRLGAITPQGAVNIIDYRDSDDTPTSYKGCLLYTSPSPRDATLSRMPSSA